MPLPPSIKFQNVPQLNLRLSSVVITLCVVLAALAGVGWSSSYALFTVLLDGLTALAVVVPAGLAGLGLIRRFGLTGLPIRWQFLLGNVLGIGAQSILILLLGTAGLLERRIWIAVIALMALAGLFRLAKLLLPKPGETAQPAPPPSRHAGWERVCWLTVAPFAAVALLATAHAPGLLWSEEGFGYDVLEYHLQMPKEYFRAGEIRYAEHNVYASFPANVEMLYLLGMILSQSDVEAGCIAHLIHLLLGALAVFAAWVVGRDCSPFAATTAAIAMATTGWLTYLCGLAYVENGMLFFGTVAAGMVLRAQRATFVRDDKDGSASPQDNSNGVASRPGMWMALAGAVAGIACGCKYTAATLIAVPLILAVLLSQPAGSRGRMALATAFIAGCSLTFSPWLIRNFMYTGNPCFPLGQRFFTSSPPGWGPEQTAQWDAAHRLSPEERPLGRKIELLWKRIPGDHEQRFGPALLLLALLGWLDRRRQWADRALGIMLAAQVLIWFFTTHLFARFAVVMLIPLCLMAGRAAGITPRPWRRSAVVITLIAGAAWNFSHVARLYQRESPSPLPPSVFYEGKLSGYEHLGNVNSRTSLRPKTLLVGESRAFYFTKPVDYTVVFNRNPFAEVVARADSESQIITWFQKRGYTHVLVNFSEISRLSRTYGFAEQINAELFNRLEKAGLQRLAAWFSLDRAHVVIYRVP